ncbi:osialoglycoprotein endopeptidase, putative [Acanthamoeba castellanii str. Neff]|uniref:N(6)-L-threonylcarbamoyladenine synthase n=1 Tax=Acanthamoeba castellanii (strain ATCC 30010 / Neff) TaxID=1257118 RepID=L8GQZ8_ACACF|nr:osialoglycoprotein endopeptidase, putative [Acanthamoeba castellanii str. Neff]ELR15425.1 osialoglycoprotein endopeptidase, putative [Acanthamoeba castellanii str. Neff]
MLLLLGEEGLVLGIESSCDDTGVALVTPSGRVVAEALSSSLAVHARESYGGVVPHIARREHERALPLLLAHVLAQAGSALSGANAPASSSSTSNTSSSSAGSERRARNQRLCAVAVTAGPGLAVCLSVGLETARNLAIESGLPFIAVNHLEAHALVARLAEPTLEFPFLVCLVSGGHTQLLYAQDVDRYLLLGAYDKMARLLELEPTRENEPAGEMLERVARGGDAEAYRFPVPLAKQKTCDFSFSGLKTRVVREVASMGGVAQLGRQGVADVAASFQRAAVRHLRDRTGRALQWCQLNRPDSPPNALVVCGGAARNVHIRHMLQELAREYHVPAIFPPLPLCTGTVLLLTPYSPLPTA